MRSKFIHIFCLGDTNLFTIEMYIDLIGVLNIRAFSILAYFPYYFYIICLSIFHDIYSYFKIHLKNNILYEFC